MRVTKYNNILLPAYQRCPASLRQYVKFVWSHDAPPAHVVHTVMFPALRHTHTVTHTPPRTLTNNTRSHTTHARSPTRTHMWTCTHTQHAHSHPHPTPPPPPPHAHTQHTHGRPRPCTHPHTYTPEYLHSIHPSTHGHTYTKVHSQMPTNASHERQPQPRTFGAVAERHRRPPVEITARCLAQRRHGVRHGRKCLCGIGPHLSQGQELQVRLGTSTAHAFCTRAKGKNRPHICLG